MHKTKRDHLIPEDKNLLLNKLFDPDNLLSLVNSNFVFPNSIFYTNIQLGHIRYSPKKSCLVSFAVFDDDGKNKHDYFVRCMNNDIYNQEKKRIININNNQYILVDNLNYLVCEFPFDSKLNLLPLIRSNDKNLGRIIRYKPEIRLVAHFDKLEYRTKKFSNVVARIELPIKVQNSFEKTLKVIDSLDQNSTFSVPSILHYSKKDSLLIQEHVSAISFAKQPLDCYLADISRVAQLLADLHTLKIEDLEQKDTYFYVNQFEKSSKTLLDGNKAIETNLNKIRIALMLKLQKISSSHTSVIHGDFHQGQVLLDKEKIWIIDLDCLAFGSPAVDLGYFYAGLKRKEMKSLVSFSDEIFNVFIKKYQKQRGIQISNHEIQFYTGFALVELALKESRRLRKNWFLKVTQLLHESLKVLQ